MPDYPAGGVPEGMSDIGAAFGPSAMYVEERPGGEASRSRAWMRGGRRLALAGLCVALLAGCSGSQDDAVAEVAREFHEAVAAGDGAAACGVLAPTTRSEVEQSAGKQCAVAILEEQIPGVSGEGSSSVFGTMAQVRYAGDVVFLTRMPAGWRVLAAGCVERSVGPANCLVKGG